MSERSMSTRTMSYKDALNEALQLEMARDQRVFILGEDVGRLGGIFGVSRGLSDEFGEHRVLDTAISESAIIGVAIGAALQGMRPVAEIMFVDFMPCAMDQIVNSLAKLIYIYGGTRALPVVVRTQQGASLGLGMHHSQSLEALFVHIPGLMVAMPATPSDAKGLLLSALRMGNPVIFIEHKRLYGLEGPVPEGDFTVPFGKGQVMRGGRDITIVSWSAMVHIATAAAEKLSGNGIDAEVIDLRTLQPWDKDLVIRSVEKTGHLVVAHEACKTAGVGAEIVASVVETSASGRIPCCVRVGARDVPIPYSETMQRSVLPDVDDVVAAAAACLERSAS